MHSGYAGYKQGVAMSNQTAESSGYLNDTTSMEACDFFEFMAIVEFVLTVSHQDGHMDWKMPPTVKYHNNFKYK